jgi:hypothetical protein
MLGPEAIAVAQSTMKTCVDRSLQKSGQNAITSPPQPTMLRDATPAPDTAK